MNVPLFLGSLLAVVLGAVDAETRRRLGTGVELGLIFGGLTGLGVHAGVVTISATSDPKP